MTITFTSDGSVTYPGWAAEISCTTYVVYGCMDPDAFNYNEEAEEEDGSCYYAPGCTDDGFVEFYTQGFEADFDNGDCITLSCLCDIGFPILSVIKSFYQLMLHYTLLLCRFFGNPYNLSL